MKLNPFEDVKTTSVELKEIRFAYGNGKEVLHNISLQAKEGQKDSTYRPKWKWKNNHRTDHGRFLPFTYGRDTLW